jgi:hypothetical protein
MKETSKKQRHFTPHFVGVTLIYMTDQPGKTHQKPHNIYNIESL